MSVQRLDLISLFPEACRGYLEASIVGRARRRGLVDIRLQDPRRWAGGRHRVVDDRPYGGGPGMVLAAPPLAACVDSLRGVSGCPILMSSAQGRHLEQGWLRQLAAEPRLIIVAGHYEGIDERFVELYRPQEFSVGDLILSGGELAALVLIDALVRLLPGALGDAASAAEDSFGADGLLDHPCYTRPEEFRGCRVPEVLLGGDHQAIAAWRAAERRRRTAQRRPDLFSGDHAAS